VKWMKL